MKSSTQDHKQAELGPEGALSVPHFPTVVCLPAFPHWCLW